MRVRGKKGHGEREIKMLYCAAFFYIVARLYLINKKAQVLLICNSRKVAKTELYNEW